MWLLLAWDVINKKINLRLLHHCVALRRYEAAGWLRRAVGVGGVKELPAEPTEEEFRLGLRSGKILCYVLNKVQPGAVPKVWFSKVFIFFSAFHMSVRIYFCWFWWCLLTNLGGWGSLWFSCYSWWGSSICIPVLWKCQKFPCSCGRIGASNFWSLWFGTGVWCS